MTIIKLDEWNDMVKINTDPYGKCICDVARKAMEILDEWGEGKDYDVYELLDDADRETNSGGITGYMAGCVAQIISEFHSGGENFRQKWNNWYGIKPEQKGIVNPAIVTVEVKEKEKEHGTKNNSKS